MPLHAEDELIGPRVDHRFDYSIGRPGYGFEVTADDVDGLMMVAVDGRVSRLREPGDERVFGDVDRVRSPPEQIPLHVLERLFDFAVYVLNERAAAIDVQGLNAEADREHRQLSRFGRREQQHVGFVSTGNNGSEFRSRLVPVTERIDVVHRARKRDCVDVRHDRLDVIGFRNQRQQQRRAARRIDRFGVGLSQLIVESVPIIAARYADYRPVFAQLTFLSSMFAPGNDTPRAGVYCESKSEDSPSPETLSILRE